MNKCPKKQNLWSNLYWHIFSSILPSFYHKSQITKHSSTLVFPCAISTQDILRCNFFLGLKKKYLAENQNFYFETLTSHFMLSCTVVLWTCFYNYDPIFFHSYVSHIISYVWQIISRLLSRHREANIKYMNILNFIRMAKSQNKEQIPKYDQNKANYNDQIFCNYE